MAQPISKKLILVLGATGAQGIAVIDSLLEPSADGTPSPYAIRALTRNPDNVRAKALAAKGVECVKGSTDDLGSVLAALQGVYGAWINTDGFTIGEQKEIYAGLRIFELAKQAKTVRHYVWSNLDYSLKKGGYNPTYKVGHYDGKGRVAEWMQAQPSNVSDDDMSWSVVTTGPYMDMLKIHMFGPLAQRPDGTFVFALPLGEGHAPLIALSDLGFWARYTFDNRALTSGKDLEIASEMATAEDIVSAFRKVTGLKAVFLPQSVDEWFDNFTGVDTPSASEGDGATTVTWKQNFSGFWSQFRDDVIKRDMDWVRRLHPGTHTLETWMRENNYKGREGTLLKIVEDVYRVSLNPEHLSTL